METNNYVQFGKIVSVILNDQNYADKVELDLGDYELVNENGKLYAEKKISFPKTFEDACKVLGIVNTPLQDDAEICDRYNSDMLSNLEDFRKLLICRDAYWKLLGNWKPIFSDDNVLFVIGTWNDTVDIHACTSKQYILSFPDYNTRNIFYKYFKKEIEKCKRFL